MDIVIVYTSMTGNTEMIAESIAEELRTKGMQVTMKDSLETQASELYQYDGILIGSYTWGDGDLPDEMLDFYEELEGIDLTGKKAAVFGSCDSSYSHFGAAVDTISEKLEDLGADVLKPGLKIELTPGEEDLETCKQFAQQFIEGNVPAN